MTTARGQVHQNWRFAPRRAHDRRGLRLVEALGVMPLALLTALLTPDGDLRNRLLARALNRLLTSRILAKVSVGEVKAHQAANLRWFVMPGPQWGAAKELLGYAPDAPITCDAHCALVVEQAVLSADLLFRVAQGANAFRDHDWLRAAAAWDHLDPLSKRRWRLTRADDGSQLPVPHDLRLVGVVPAAGHEDVHPLIFVGGGWTTVDMLARTQFAMSMLSPVDLAYVRTTKTRHKIMRRIAAAMTMERAPGRVEPLGQPGIGMFWESFWLETFEFLAVRMKDESTASLTERVCGPLCADTRATWSPKPPRRVGSAA